MDEKIFSSLPTQNPALKERLTLPFFRFCSLYAAFYQGDNGKRVTGRTDQVGRLVGSLTVFTAKVRCLLGWSPRFTLDEGLRETVDWYASNAGVSR